MSMGVFVLLNELGPKMLVCAPNRHNDPPTAKGWPVHPLSASRTRRTAIKLKAQKRRKGTSQMVPKVVSPWASPLPLAAAWFHGRLEIKKSIIGVGYAPRPQERNISDSGKNCR